MLDDDDFRILVKPVFRCFVIVHAVFQKMIHQIEFLIGTDDDLSVFGAKRIIDGDLILVFPDLRTIVDIKDDQ